MPNNIYFYSNLSRLIYVFSNSLNLRRVAKRYTENSISFQYPSLASNSMIMYLNFYYKLVSETLLFYFLRFKLVCVDHYP